MARLLSETDTANGLRIEEYNWGTRVIMPERPHNSEFEYSWRRVRRINDDCPYEQELIAELERDEEKLIPILMERINEMNDFFSQVTDENVGYIFNEWEEEHGRDFNEFFHDFIERLCDTIDGCSFEYARRSKHGWCL